MMSFQYWLGGSPENLQSMLLSLATTYVPAVVERTFYRRVFGFYSVVLDYVLADVSLSVLDVDMDVALRRDPE